MKNNLLKVAIVLSLCIISIGSLGIFSVSATGIEILLDSRQVSFDQPPVIENGRTLVPLRAIFEAMGATVMWDGNTQTVFAVKGTDMISMTVGKYSFTKNSAMIPLDVPPKIVNDRTLVPVRAIAESFGANVEWDGANQKVIITTSGGNNENPNNNSGITINDWYIELLNRTYGELKSLCGGIAENQLISGGTPYTEFNNGVIAQYWDYDNDLILNQYYNNGEFPSELRSNTLYAPAGDYFNSNGEAITYNNLKKSFPSITAIESVPITDEYEHGEIYGYDYVAEFSYDYYHILGDEIDMKVRFEMQNGVYVAIGVSYAQLN